MPHTPETVVDAILEAIGTILLSDDDDKTKTTRITKLVRSMLNAAVIGGVGGGNMGDGPSGDDDQTATESHRSDAMALQSNYVGPITPRKMSRNELILAARHVAGKSYYRQLGLSKGEIDVLESEYLSQQDKEIDLAIARRAARNRDRDGLKGVTGQVVQGPARVREYLNLDAAGLNSKLSDAAGIMGHSVRHDGSNH